MLQKPETFSFDKAAPLALASICGFLLIAKIIPMISQIASNTQSVTLNSASARLIGIAGGFGRGAGFGGAGTRGNTSATTAALNTSGGTTYGNPRDHDALEAQERRAAARRQKRNL